MSFESSRKAAPLKVGFALVLIGVVAGLGSAGFLTMLQVSVEWFFVSLAHYLPLTPGHEALPVTHLVEGDAPIRWVLLVLPTLGGLLAGLITFFLAPEVEGHGTDAAINAYHYKDGKVRRRVPILKAVTSALTIGTGGSGGREGPIAQIGSGFGSMLADWLGFPPHVRRVMMAAGMAAGIGAIFHAPLAGAIFAAEVMYQGPDLEFELLVPSFITCIVAYSIFGLFHGFEPLFITPAYQFEDPTIFLPLLILALISTLGAILYTKMFYGVRGIFFETFHAIPDHVKPMLGGVVTGVMGFFLPEVLGTGYGVLQACFSEPGTGVPGIDGLLSYGMVSRLLSGVTNDPALLAAALLGAIALGKIATTSFSIGSGGSGGVFGPAVVIGGALGASTGFVCYELFPGMPIEPGAFAILGMAGFFAGAANTPISTIIMISEMTGNHNLLLPSMFVCVTTYYLCRRSTLYREQIQSRYDASSKRGSMGRAYLSQLTVGGALAKSSEGEVPLVRDQMPAAELIEQYENSPFDYLPVVDGDGQILGVLPTASIQTLSDMVGTQKLIIAADLMVRTPFVTREESLLVVANTLQRHGVPALPVVDESNFLNIVGVICEKDLLATLTGNVEDS